MARTELILSRFERGSGEDTDEDFGDSTQEEEEGEDWRSVRARTSEHVRALLQVRAGVVLQLSAWHISLMGFGGQEDGARSSALAANVSRPDGTLVPSGGQHAASESKAIRMLHEAIDILIEQRTHLLAMRQDVEAARNLGEEAMVAQRATAESLAEAEALLSDMNEESEGLESELRKASAQGAELVARNDATEERLQTTGMELGMAREEREAEVVALRKMLEEEWMAFVARCDEELQRAEEARRDVEAQLAQALKKDAQRRQQERDARLREIMMRMREERARHEADLAALRAALAAAQERAEASATRQLAMEGQLESARLDLGELNRLTDGAEDAARAAAARKLDPDIELYRQHRDRFLEWQQAR